MLTIREAAKIAVRKEKQDSCLDAFEYKDLYVFHMLLEGAAKESECHYSLSVNKNTGECKVFDTWNEAFSNPDEFIPASKKRIPSEQFLK